jgi:hypothetical protein
MAAITFPNAFTNGQVGIGDELQGNFSAASTVINGNIDSTNIKATGNLSVSALITSSIVTPQIINPSLTENFELTYVGGSKQFKITNNSDASLFEVDISGNITIPLGMTALYPMGTIIYFTGTWTNNSTMKGWYSCDGTNGTPDLRAKFIRGSSTSGQTGGYSNITLGNHTHTASSGNNSTTHTHSVSGTLESSGPGAHEHTFYFFSLGGGGNTLRANGNLGGELTHWHTASSPALTHTHSVSGTLSADTDTHTHTVTIDAAGAGETGVGDNLPAYYTLIPVCRVA